MMGLFSTDARAIAALAAMPEVGKALTDAATKVADRAAELAPDHTGRNRKSYKTRPAELEDGVQRAVAYSDDPFDHLIEFGSANNPPYRPLTRAAQELGFDFKDAR